MRPIYEVTDWDDDDMPGPAIDRLGDHEEQIALTRTIAGVSDTVWTIIDVNNRINIVESSASVSKDVSTLYRQREELVKSLLAQATVLASMEMTAPPA